MKYHKTPQFQKLQTEWYQKLQDAGFKDLEHLYVGGKQVLKEKASNVITRHLKSQVEREIREEYYRKAGHCYHDEKFETFYEHYVMKCYVEGMKFIEIARQLKKEDFKGRDVRAIRQVVAKYEAKWNLK